MGQKGFKDADATAAGFTDLLSSVAKQGIKPLGGLNSLLATIGASGESVSPAALGLAQLLIPMSKKDSLKGTFANSRDRLYQNLELIWPIPDDISDDILQS